MTYDIDFDSDLKIENDTDSWDDGLDQESDDDISEDGDSGDGGVPELSLDDLVDMYSSEMDEEGHDNYDDSGTDEESANDPSDDEDEYGEDSDEESDHLTEDETDADHWADTHRSSEDMINYYIDEGGGDGQVVSPEYVIISGEIPGVDFEIPRGDGPVWDAEEFENRPLGYVRMPNGIYVEKRIANAMATQRIPVDYGSRDSNHEYREECGDEETPARNDEEYEKRKKKTNIVEELLDSLFGKEDE